MYCHTNNLAVVQEAWIGCNRPLCRGLETPGFELGNGNNRCLVIYPYAGQPNYEVFSNRDYETHEFATFADAMDFCAAEMRMAN